MSHYAQGVITDCFQLELMDGWSIDANFARSLTCLTEVKVDLTKSDDKFYCVTAPSGGIGFCQKQYVALRE